SVSFARALGLAVMAGIIGTLGIFLLAPILADHNHELTVMIRIASVALIPSLLTGCFRGLARGYHRWAFVVTEQLVSSLVKLGAIAALYFSDQLTPFNASIVLSSAMFIGLFPYLFLLKRLDQVDGDVQSSQFLKFGVAV